MSNIFEVPNARIIIMAADLRIHTQSFILLLFSMYAVENIYRINKWE